MGTDGVRDSSYVLSEYDKDDQLREFILFQVVGNQVNVSDLVNESQIWASRAGFRPLAVPLMRFRWQRFEAKEDVRCPAPVWQQYMALFISVIVVVVLIIASLLAVCFYILHSKSVETRRLNEAWQISFAHLSRVTSKKEAESSRSLQSGPSTTSAQNSRSTRSNPRRTSIMYRPRERIGDCARKYQVRRSLSAENMAELRLMRQMDHENVLKFIGLSIDGPEFMSIWRFCGRRDRTRGNMNIDAFFVYSLIRDLAEGLHYIHHSPLQTHGRLKSSYCLIDDRWQAKISYYGLSFLRDQTSTREARDLLWTAPEILRNGDDKPTKQADVYSFAIVCSEIINMKPAWDNEMKGNHEEEVPVRFARRSEPEIADISQGIFHLVRDCWGEDPSHRPKSDQIRAVLKSLNGGRNASLMDHVFAILEQHASNLEMEVEEQTKQLVEEKKRSDVLFYRMLPRVTIFFSDVVSFTTIASKCTPLQVISLLNDFYTTLDSIIAEYDVYKVETIGDGYLCVSGLPKRNGNQHAKHIADMSLHFMRALKNFTIPHLPGERVRLRIGIHTGPCVAGVVGLAMPRYCLFGCVLDRWKGTERIHLSGAANDFLLKVIGGYETESRAASVINLIGLKATTTPPPAVTIALDRVYRGTNSAGRHQLHECVECTAIGYAFEMIVKQKVDVLFAPPCIDGAVLAGHVGAFYNFTNAEMYPTVLSVLPNYEDLGNVICEALKFLDWDLFALIYQQNEDEDMESVANDREGCVIGYKEVVDSWADADIANTLEQIKAKARIVVMCFDDPPQQRLFTIKLQEAGMDTQDYARVELKGINDRNGLQVYLFVDTDMQNLGLTDTPFWLDTNATGDGKDEKSWKIAEKSFLLHVDKTSSLIDSDEADSFTNFSTEVVQRMADWPFYCKHCAETQTNASIYASTLYDAMFSRVVNISGTDPKFYRDGTLLDSQFGHRVRRSGRGAQFDLHAFDVRGQTGHFEAVHHVRGRRQRSRGFDGKGCPIDFFTEYRGYVNMQNLVQMTSKNKAMESARSITSGPSTTSTKFTFDSIKSTKHYVVYVYGGERVIGINHNLSPTQIRIAASDMAEMRTMRTMDHDNVNRFIGLAVNGGAETISDVINGKYLLSTMDAFFIYSLVRDICDGLKYIQASSVQWHGNLTSPELPDRRPLAGQGGATERTALSDFGLKFLRNAQPRQPGDLLWTAPELLRDNQFVGSKSGDVYSFAIIASEILNMKPPFESEQKLDVEGKCRVHDQERAAAIPSVPTLDPVAQDLSPAFQHLVRDCWSENPSERPRIETVHTLLGSMNTSRSSNLMDHIFAMLENYAGNLESEIEDRTRELLEEKKKSDILLYRMLPKQVAEKLKLGQSIEPESFESVTIFFSDVAWVEKLF
ncbi:Guanylate cyclase [Aphelenchoides fujianensis]|nr:Guanylate cyclase [Aphelenchoides fujianensis]